MLDMQTRQLAQCVFGVAILTFGLMASGCSDDDDDQDVILDDAGLADDGSIDDGDDDDADVGDVDAGDDDDETAGENGDAEAAATFTEVNAMVLAPSCATPNCHGAGAPQMGLDLETDPYSAIVEVDSMSGLTYVVPGDADGSFFYDKIASETPVQGVPMPPIGELTPAQIELVRSWIEAGALDN